MWWIICIAIFIISWCVMGYGLYTADVVPDDFELKDEDIWPGNDERSDVEGGEKNAN